MTIEELVQQDLHKPAFHRLFDTMRRYAVSKMEWHFDGSGDSGNMEPEVYNWVGLHDDKIAPKDIKLDPPATVQEPNGQRMEDTPDGGHKWVTCYEDKLVNNLEELGYMCASIVLNNDPHDWYNNDGGFGDIIFEITPEGNNRIACDMNVRIVESQAYPAEAEFSHG